MTDQPKTGEIAVCDNEPASDKALLAGLIAAVCLTVFIVYWPALSAKALSWDDNQYLTENSLVRNPGLVSTWRFLTEVRHPSSVEGYYQPLTMISLMVDYALGGRPDHLTVFHFTSMLLHTANTALIIILLYFLFGRVWIAAAVGLLFGIHPLTVETIPWVGERKTLLSTFFALLSVISYVRFTRNSQRKFFIWSVGLYVLALLSKPTSTPLPAMLLLMDFWPLKRLKLSCLWEKIPFFIVGGVSAVITCISQSRGAQVIMPEQYGGAMRIPLVICHNIIFYLYKIIWPANQTSHYPFPDPLNLSQPMILTGVVGTAVLIPVLLISLYRTRAALTGWLIFFIMILPTMQVLQFSDVIASDKFAYLPSVGLLMALASFLAWISGRHRRLPAITMIIILILAGGEALATRNYLRIWRDSYTLFSYMVNITPNDAGPRYNLGIVLMDMNDLEGARREFETVLKLTPKASDALYNLAGTYAQENQIDAAIEHYNGVLKLAPGNAHAYSALAYMYIKKGDTKRAFELYYEGLKYNPQDDLLHGGLGSLLLQMGQVDEAIPELETSIKIKPNAEIYCNLGAIFYSKGETEKAFDCYQNATRLNPGIAEAHYNLGNIYLEKDRLTAAIGSYEKAIIARPGYSKAYSNMGVAFLQMDLPDKAIEQFRRATEIDPNNLDAHFNLATALADKEQLDEAIAEFQHVLKIDPNYPDALTSLQKATEDRLTAEQHQTPGKKE